MREKATRRKKKREGRERSEGKMSDRDISLGVFNSNYFVLR